jgi:hypothetical protein
MIPPYLGLFLLARGCRPAQVGIVHGILAAMRVATPYAWVTIADRSLRLVAAVAWLIAWRWLHPDSTAVGRRLEYCLK